MYTAIIKGYNFFFLLVYISQIVGRGHFATVFQATYKGSAVAVKLLPEACKQIFTTEKEIYELPLLKHAGIVSFLGAGRKPDDRSCFIVLQFVECVSEGAHRNDHKNIYRCQSPLIFRVIII